MSNSTLRARLAFHQIDEATSAILREQKDFLLSELPAVLDRFYVLVSGVSETSAYFSGREHMLSAKNAQVKHWSMILDGRFDDHYEASVRRIGEVHNRIGLDPTWYLGGYNALVNGVIEVIHRKMPTRAPSNLVVDRMLKELNIDRKTALQRAVAKAAFLDMDIAISVYIEAGRRDRRATLDKLADQFNAAVGGVVAAVAATAQELQAALTLWATPLPKLRINQLPCRLLQSKLQQTSELSRLRLTNSHLPSKRLDVRSQTPQKSRAKLSERRRRLRTKFASYPLPPSGSEMLWA